MNTEAIQSTEFAPDKNGGIHARKSLQKGVGMSDIPTFGIYDASISATAKDRKPAKHGRALDWETYSRIKDKLRELGFTVTKDPRIEKYYPILSGTHDAGHHGALKFKCAVYPAGCKFEFYQDLVTENSNGGQYDFDKLDKMPYLVRLRWQYTINALRQHLLERGFIERAKRLTPNPDPLAFFNLKWDMGEMSRGKLRFDRGPDGWPSDKELSSWDRKDHDGSRLNHGEIRYFRDGKGYLQRGRVYGGINGMWMVIYGPGACDCTYLNAKELFICNPAEVLRKLHPRRAARINAELKKAVSSEDFERAAVLRDQRDKVAACRGLWRGCA